MHDGEPYHASSAATNHLIQIRRAHIFRCLRQSGIAAIGRTWRSRIGSSFRDTLRT
jgi:hypothetical protein